MAKGDATQIKFYWLTNEGSYGPIHAVRPGHLSREECQAAIESLPFAWPWEVEPDEPIGVEVAGITWGKRWTQPRRGFVPFSPSDRCSVLCDESHADDDTKIISDAEAREVLGQQTVIAAEAVTQ